MYVEMKNIVKKYGDFYVVNVKISLDNCDRMRIRMKEIFTLMASG